MNILDALQFVTFNMGMKRWMAGLAGLSVAGWMSVQAQNTPPTISDIPDQSTAVSTPKGPIPFTVGDTQTAPDALAVSARSSNQAVVLDSSVLAGGAGSNRSLVVMPNSGVNGQTIITITVTDGGGLATSDQFVLTVGSGGGPISGGGSNTAPTISNIPDQTTPVGVSAGPIFFTVSDAETLQGELVVTAQSSNLGLVPQGNITVGVAGAGRAIIVAPAPGVNGVATITVTVSDGSLTASDSFLLTVGTGGSSGGNTAPTISNIGDAVTQVGISAGPFAFSIADAETPAANLTLSAQSSNTGLVPNSNIAFGGSGGTRTVLVTPAAGQSGTAIITVTVSDSQLTSFDTFLITVGSSSGGGGGGGFGNTVPILSNIQDQTAVAGVPTSPIPFTVSDDETAATSLVVSGKSSNQAIVPNSGFAFGGFGNNRTVIITPAQGASGTAVMTISVSDGLFTSSDDFNLTVTSSGGGGGSNLQPPTISNIPDQSVPVGQIVGPVAFTVSDSETPAANLTLTGLSSNTALVPNGSILFGGSGSSRSVIISPNAGISGTATITVTVHDGSLTASDTFVVSVGTGGGGNTAPTVSNIPDQTAAVGQTVGPIVFTVADAQTDAGSLVVTANSSNTTLVPSTSLLLGGSGATRSLFISPAAGISGTATITVTASDGSLSGSDTFLLTVGSGSTANTPPTISDTTDKSTGVGQTIGPIAFTVNDAQTPAANLTVTGQSSNPTLVSSTGILFGGSGTSRAVIITPNPGATGTATITITVSDGSLTASDSFVLTVGGGGGGGNTAPTISNITDKSTPVGTPLGPVPFTIGDAETAADLLTVTGRSSNAAVIQDSSVLIGGAGADRALIITPNPGASGSAVITITVSDGALSASDSFTVTVGSGAVNTPPTISNVADQTGTMGQPIGPLTIQVNDAETAAASLVLSGSSSNKSLVPDASLLFGGAGTARALIITPSAGATGTTVITITVSDGTLTASDMFTVSIGSGAGANTPPTISSINDLSTPVGVSVGPLSFTVNDQETPAVQLKVTAQTSDPFVVPLGNILLGGSGSNRVVIVTPAAGRNGTVQITLTVSDDEATAEEKFVLTVGTGSGGGNTAPTISDIADQVTGIGLATGPIAFTVDDAETSASALTVTAASSDTVLVPLSAIVLQGSGTNRTVNLTPAAGRTGQATITLTVSDGSLTAQQAFLLTVSAGQVNTPPTISDITDKSTTTGIAVGPIPFTISDENTAAEALTVTAVSSNTTLVPASNLQLGGVGASRSITVIPSAGRTGTAVITVRVSDGVLSASDDFTVTVTSSGGGPNTPPTISNIPDQRTVAGRSTAPFEFQISDAETSADRLVVTTGSSNTNLVPRVNIQISGTGTNRTIVVTPAGTQVGRASILVAVSDGALTASDIFAVTVDAAEPVNTEPTISAIADMEVVAGQASDPVPFTIGDAETPAQQLQLSLASSDLTILPLSALVLGGSGTDRTLVVNPPPGVQGTSSVSVTVSDGTLFASSLFEVRIQAPNAPPTISSIGTQTVSAGLSSAPIAFTVNDAETAADALTVTATSADKVLLPDTGLVVSGTGANRNLVITPPAGGEGTTTVSVVVSDGLMKATNEFALVVTVGNRPPVVSPIADQEVQAGVLSAAIPFQVSDPETPAADLLVEASSSNVSLLPSSGLVLGGAGTNRTVQLRATAGQSGSVVVSIVVSDGALTTTSQFHVTVIAPRVPPSIVEQPQDVAVVPGGTATFMVKAEGTAPLQYQWLFNGERIAGQTNETLVISNAQEKDLGNYTVVISNPLGLTISDLVHLELRQPLILEIAVQNHVVELTITGSIGEEYEIMATEDFLSWKTVAILTNTSGEVRYVDPDSFRLAKRFYQVLVRAAD